MNTGTITGAVAIIGALLSYLGITGVDAAAISNGVNGVIAFITLIAIIWTNYEHHKAIAAIK